MLVRLKYEMARLSSTTAPGMEARLPNRGLNWQSHVIGSGSRGLDRAELETRAGDLIGPAGAAGRASHNGWGGRCGPSRVSLRSPPWIRIPENAIAGEQEARRRLHRHQQEGRLIVGSAEPHPASNGRTRRRAERRPSSGRACCRSSRGSRRRCPSCPARTE
jgi:hypothetical protein